jgi:hypothetical protein
MRPVICAFADSREQRAKGEDGSRKAIADDGNRGGGGGGGGWRQPRRRGLPSVGSVRAAPKCT